VLFVRHHRCRVRRVETHLDEQRLVSQARRIQITVDAARLCVFQLSQLEEVRALAVLRVRVRATYFHDLQHPDDRQELSGYKQNRADRHR